MITHGLNLRSSNSLLLASTRDVTVRALCFCKELMSAWNMTGHLCCACGRQPRPLARAPDASAGCPSAPTSDLAPAHGSWYDVGPPASRGTPPQAAEAWGHDERCQPWWRDACHTLRHSAAVPAALLWMPFAKPGKSKVEGADGDGRPLHVPVQEFDEIDAPHRPARLRLGGSAVRVHAGVAGVRGHRWT